MSKVLFHVGLLLCFHCVAFKVRTIAAIENPRSIVVVRPESVIWMGDPLGMQSARIAGDPQKPGEEFTLWLKMPARFMMAPHWHPVDENLVVLSGEFLIGIREVVDEKGFIELKQGDFVQIPMKTPHYGAAKTDPIVQIHGMGPFITNWIVAREKQPNQEAWEHQWKRAST